MVLRVYRTCECLLVPPVPIACYAPAYKGTSLIRNCPPLPRDTRRDVQAFGTGVPHPYKNAHPPRTTIGPSAEAYSGVGIFLCARYPYTCKYKYMQGPTTRKGSVMTFSPDSQIRAMKLCFLLSCYRGTSPMRKRPPP